MTISELVSQNAKQSKSKGKKAQKNKKKTLDHGLFKDIQQLHKDTTYCWRHGTECEVVTDALGFASCGFSCKNLSRLFSSESFASDNDWIGKGEGSTGETFEGLLHWLLRSPPLLVQCENVVGIAKPQHSKAVIDAFGRAGYHAYFSETKSSTY